MIEGLLSYKYQKEDGAEMFRGFSGINAATAPEFVDGSRPIYSLNMTGRYGLYGNRMGYINTRPGFADFPKYGWPAWDDGNPAHVGDVPTNNPVRLWAKWYPGSGLAPTGQTVRLVGAAFQYNNNDGSGWMTPAGANALNATQYPQWMVFGAPGLNKKLFLFVDLFNGLCCWDGTNFWQQTVPLPGGGAVSGLMWLAQSEGRLFVGGNWIDPAGRLYVHYCKPGEVGDPTDPTNTVNWLGPFGGFFPVYAGNRFGEGTRTTALVSDLGRLWVFTEKGRYCVTNAGLSDETVDFYPGYGCISGKTMWSEKGSYFWWDKIGGYEWNLGGNPRDISREIFPLFNNLKFRNAAGDFIAHNYFSFIYLDQYITVARTDLDFVTGDELNTWFVFDLVDRKWNIWNIPATCADICDAGTDLNMLYFGSPVDTNPGGSAQYKTYRFGVDDQTGLPIFDDDGSDDESLWVGGKDGYGSIETRKQYWFLRLRAEASGDTGTIGAKTQFYMDDDDDLAGTITMTNGSPDVVGVNTKFTQDYVAGQAIILRAQRNIGTLPVILTVTDDTNIVLTGNFTGTTGSGDHCKPTRFTWPADPASLPFHKLGFTGRPFGYMSTIEYFIKSQRRISIKTMEGLFRAVDIDSDMPGF